MWMCSEWPNCGHWINMSTIEERSEYLQNPFFTKHVYGDFTSFYITITVCTVFGIFLFALNLICGCCSKHKSYWNDRYTGDYKRFLWNAFIWKLIVSGNRWLVSLWTATPHKQPPLDLTELEDIEIEYPNSYPVSTPKATIKLPPTNCKFDF